MELAKLAKVSKGAVSRVLNWGDAEKSISEGTKKRILKLAKELNYKPNINARRLATGSRENIGVVYQANDFFRSGPIMEILNGVVESAAQLGYCVSIGGKISGRDEPKIKIIEDRAVDGIVIIPPVEKNITDEITNWEVPVVTANSAENLDHDSITCDDENGAAQVMKFLLQLGHQRIAHISYQSIHKSVLIRRNIYEKYMIENALKPKTIVKKRDKALEADFIKLIRNYHPTAIFAYHDNIAWELYFICASLGIRIPDDLSVIGVNDCENDLEVIPALSTLRIPFRKIGEKAVEMLDKKIKSKQSVKTVNFAEELIIRKSCAAPSPQN
jgi:DNA-binding LacI/PurR family transcriptional regulator